MNSEQENICFVGSDVGEKFQSELFTTTSAVELSNAVAANGLVMLSGENDRSIVESLTLPVLQKHEIIENGFKVIQTEEAIDKSFKDKSVSFLFFTSRAIQPSLVLLNTERHIVRMTRGVIVLLSATSSKAISTYCYHGVKNRIQMFQSNSMDLFCKCL